MIFQALRAHEKNLMSTEQNKKLSNLINENIISQGNLALADEILSPDYVDHNALPGLATGITGFKQGVEIYRSAFSDLKIKVDDMIADGDKVVTRWTATGTHNGELMGIPPTGSRVSISGISIDRCANGKIAEHWDVFDQLGMMQQLGVIPMQ
jgi:steroid delta-isomerase-like uncharacterized protein